MVETTTGAGQGGALYTEGAVAELRLLDPSGVEVATLRAGRDPLVFRDLAAGSYVLKPALLPCSGSCDILDDRTDGCRGAVDVAGRSTVTVHFRVGADCEIER